MPSSPLSDISPITTTLIDKGPIVCLLFRRVGDSLLAVPAIRALRETYPNHVIDVYAETQALRMFQGLPFITNIVDCGKSSSLFALTKILRGRGTPAAVLDFLSDPRSAMAAFLSGAKVRVGIGSSLRSILYSHQVAQQNPVAPIYSAIHKLKLAEQIGSINNDIRLEFSLTNSERKWAENLWSERSWQEIRVAAIFPTSRRVYKCWPREKFAELIRSLSNNSNLVPILIGSQSETEELRQVAYLANLQEQQVISCNSVGNMAAVLARCKVLIGNDGGPKHIACAMRVPTITIFRSDPWQFWTPPDDPRHIAFTDYDNSLSVADVLNAVNTQVERTAPQ